MTAKGRCYCGAVRFEVRGGASRVMQCHCRECQYISGGNPNVVAIVAAPDFEFAQGAPKSYTRTDLEAPVTREFCAECGTHLLTRSPRMPNAVIIKLGTLDDPAIFGDPQIAIFAAERQPFHSIPPGLPTFERRPQ